jgi:hypothetical protein
VNIADRANPQLIGTVPYNGKNTHSASTSEDGKYLFVADEQDGYPCRVFNVEDPTNPFEVAQYTANDSSLVHNPYVRGDFCFVSHNTEGLRVLDISDPTLPVEVGYYDTWPGQSGGFLGLWSACPYFPSGKIIGGNRTDGLYVWEFNGTRAARIYGTVSDSLTGLPLLNGTVAFAAPADTLLLDFTGSFKKGLLEGSYQLTAQAPGYQSKSLEINLLQGDSLFVGFELLPEGYSTAHPGRTALPHPKLYPNPSDGRFTVDLSGLSGVTFIKIFDANGSELSRLFTEGKRTVEVRLTNFSVQTGIVAIFDQTGSLVATARFSTF